jgi:hypothetical protein
MKTSEIERGEVTNNDTKLKSTKKKMKVTQDNIPFGHVCDGIAVDDDTPYVRIYCQNVSGIFDREGIGLYINYYLKAAALLLNVLERQKVSSRPADYSILLY